MKEYTEFLKKKISISKDYGFDVDESELPSFLLPHQKKIVAWAIKGGRRAIFASFGLGKTLMQLVTVQTILRHKHGKALVIAPLGVQQEFKEDARKFLGIEIKYIKTQEEAEQANDGTILITNYERVRDGNIEPNYFTAVTLDEASVLRGFGTKTYQSFLNLFPDVKYKFVATATPSPNKYKELIHYAGFLGVMDTGQALTRFFKRDSTKANKLTIYPHKEKEFWYWVSSWGVFINKPSDIDPSFSDEGYDMPEIKYHWHKIESDHSSAGVDRDGQVKMFRSASLSLQDASKEKRDSLKDRAAKMSEILSTDESANWLIWHHQEAERHEINKHIGKGFDVYGSQDLELREKRILDFAYGRSRFMSTKPVIAGSGVNFQRFCNKAVFIGIDYKFNDFIQAVHRIYRFGQTKQVEIHIIYTESESEIKKALLEKQAQHYKLVENMVNIVKEHGLNAATSAQKLIRTMGVERKMHETENYKVYNNDSTLEFANMEENSIGLAVTSIPFSNHYEYTPSYNDFGHTKDNAEFWEQMDFLTPSVYRALMPGRIFAVHVKDRILFSSMTDFSFPTVSPFHAEAIFHYMKHNFGFLGMVTIETDVVRENNQTYRLGWSEKCKDGSKMGIGSPEYLLLFRKQPTSHDKAYADIPVQKDKSVYTRGQWQIDARAKWNSSGNRFLTPTELKHFDIEQINKMFKGYFESEVYDYEKHVKTANDLDALGRLPSTFETLRLKSRNWFLWDDVNRMQTMNSEQSKRKQQNHICPLQFDIVDRVINRFSNKGEWVADPFGGLFTTVNRAVKLGRKGVACELNSDYYRDGLSYLRALESKVNMPTLFDTM